MTAKEIITKYNYYLIIAYLILKERGLDNFKVSQLGNIENRIHEDPMTEGIEIYYFMFDNPYKTYFTRISYEEFDTYCEKEW